MKYNNLEDIRTEVIWMRNLKTIEQCEREADEMTIHTKSLSQKLSKYVARLLHRTNIEKENPTIQEPII